MTALLHPRTWLPTLALLALGLPAGAAPVRPTTPGVLPSLEKYMPNDADGVLLFNVKQVLASPLYTKNFKTKFDTLLAKDEVKPYLKDIGFDPMKDIGHLAVILSRSCHSETFGKGDGPILMVFGKFDPAKMKKKLEGLAKEHPKVVKISDATGGKLYEIGQFYGNGPGYAAILDKGTLIIGPRKEHATDALAKANGKKRTKLKYPALTAALKKWKAKTSVQGIALESMVVDTTYHFEKGAGGGKKIFHTLGERGFKLGVLNVQVKDDAAGKCTLSVKDKAKLKDLLKKWTDGKAEIVREGRRAAEMEAGFGPMINFLENLTLKGTTDAIVIEGKASAQVFKSFLDLTIFRARP
jgi:hypothetical protein